MSFMDSVAYQWKNDCSNSSTSVDSNAKDGTLTKSRPPVTILTDTRNHNALFRLQCDEKGQLGREKNISDGNYLPSIPVAMRYPYTVSSVKQYRSEEQQQQLTQSFVSEAFIPMMPNITKPPRKRRRPPFSYSSLIAQAILESDNERLTLREIYRWIVDKYPALYNANDVGWQNTIRHNLSLNRCFKKLPKLELNSSTKSKGGYWTIDPEHMAKFKNGAFIRGSSSTLRRQSTSNNTKESHDCSEETSSSPSSNDHPVIPLQSLPSSLHPHVSKQSPSSSISSFASLVSSPSSPSSLSSESSSISISQPSQQFIQISSSAASIASSPLSKLVSLSSSTTQPLPPSSAKGSHSVLSLSSSISSSEPLSSPSSVSSQSLILSSEVSSSSAIMNIHHLLN